ncbi:uncharacterized protein LOC142541806 [Primulina tabacum]|uniref:uncharacterized protein LOC142541806 n=1 Tax=Primulina tabacum TaxID=48773 RepID=UPI003F59B360
MVKEFTGLDGIHYARLNLMVVWASVIPYPLIKLYLLNRDGGCWFIRILSWLVYSKQNTTSRATFREPGLGHNPSYVWRSLLWGRELLKKGMRWRISFGRNDLRICDLRTPFRVWDWNIVQKVLWLIDHEEVRPIPLGNLDGDDDMVWFYYSSGAYKVKSGYHLVRSSDVDGSHRDRGRQQKCYKRLWSLNIPPDVKIFIWRACSEALPTCFLLAKRGISVGPSCSRCDKRHEDNIHACFCNVAKDVWNFTALWPLLARFIVHTFMDLFCWVMKQGLEDDTAIFATISWRLKNIKK